MNHPLDVKLAQMLIVGFRGATPDECRPFLEQIRRHAVGGVWLTDADSPMARVPGNVRSPAQLKTLIAALQDAAPIPLLVSIDAEGGQVIRLKESLGFPAFPSPQSLGERDDVDLTRREAGRLADTLRELGINFNLAPVVDLNTQPANPIIGSRGRAYSDDPHRVTRHAAAFIQAHHERGIACALKHFPGHGSSRTDSHLDMVDVTRTWSDTELLPYRDLVSHGLADAVLSAHVFIRGIDPDHPATLSPKIMTGLLREQLRFDGVVLSDDMNMGAIQRYYTPQDALAQALDAGIDVIVHGNCDHYDEHIIQHTLDHLHRLLDTGRLTEARVDASFQRIMKLKQRYAGAPGGL